MILYRYLYEINVSSSHLDIVSLPSVKEDQWSFMLSLNGGMKHFKWEEVNSFLNDASCADVFVLRFCFGIIYVVFAKKIEPVKGHHRLISR